MLFISCLNCLLYLWTTSLASRIYGSARLWWLKSIFHKEIKIEENNIDLRQWKQKCAGWPLCSHGLPCARSFFFKHTHTLNGPEIWPPNREMGCHDFMGNCQIHPHSVFLWDRVGGGRGRGRRGGCCAERGGVFSAAPRPLPPRQLPHITWLGLVQTSPRLSHWSFISPAPTPPPWQTATTWAGKPKPVRVWQCAHVCPCACTATPLPQKKDTVLIRKYCKSTSPLL